jgi:hypothetical protein
MALITKKELACTLGITERWVSQLVISGALHPAGVFGNLFDQEEAVEEWNAYQERTASAQEQQRRAKRIEKIIQQIVALTPAEREQLRSRI